MRSEKQRVFRNGFELNEQELRRIYDTAYEQVRNGQELDPVDSTYEVRFKSGVIDEPRSIDEIADLENYGEQQIISLTIDLQLKSDVDSRRVHIGFVDAESYDAHQVQPIHYEVTGSERDWVFVTTSKLDERIAKIKKTYLFRPLASSSLKSKARYAPIVLILFLFIIVLFALLENLRVANMAREAAINTVETRWRNGEISDAADLNIELHRIRLSSSDITVLPYALFAIAFVFILFTVIHSLLSPKLFPIYNFLWGYYKEEFEKRRSVAYAVASLIVITIVLGLILEVVGNYISSLVL